MVEKNNTSCELQVTGYRLQVKKIKTLQVKRPKPGMME
jgi:hypothetical protein